MTPRERMLCAIQHREPDIIPYSLDFEADAHERVREWYGGEIPAHTNHIAERGFAWDGPIGEDGVSTDLFGVRWFHASIFHQINRVLPEPDLNAYTFPDPVPLVDVPALATWCSASHDLFRVYGIGMMFFERAWALRGMEGILMDMASEPGFCDALFERLAEMHHRILDLVLPIDFDAILFGDDFGGQRGLLMGAPAWRRFLKPHLTALYGRVRDAGKLVMIHSCGDNTDILPDLIDMGLNVFNPFQPEAHDVRFCKREYGAHLTFDGGIGTQGALAFGAPEDVRRHVEDAIRTLGPGGGWHMRASKAFRPETPTENVVACIECILEQPGYAP